MTTEKIKREVLSIRVDLYKRERHFIREEGARVVRSNVRFSFPLKPVDQSGEPKKAWGGLGKRLGDAHSTVTSLYGVVPYTVHTCSDETGSWDIERVFASPAICQQDKSDRRQALLDLANLRHEQYQAVPNLIREWTHVLPSGRLIVLLMSKKSFERAGERNIIRFRFTLLTGPASFPGKYLRAVEVGLQRHMNQAYAFMAKKFLVNAGSYIHEEALPEIDDKAARKIGVLFKDAREFSGKVKVAFRGGRY